LQALTKLFKHNPSARFGLDTSTHHQFILSLILGHHLLYRMFPARTTHNDSNAVNFRNERENSLL